MRTPILYLNKLAGMTLAEKLAIILNARDLTFPLKIPTHRIRWVVTGRDSGYWAA